MHTCTYIHTLMHMHRYAHTQYFVSESSVGAKGAEKEEEKTTLWDVFFNLSAAIVGGSYNLAGGSQESI